MSETLLLQARKNIQRGDQERARALLAQLIKEDPRNVQAWMLLAEAVDTKGQATFCLEQALKLDPSNSTALKWLAILNPAQYAQPEPEPPSPPAAMMKEGCRRSDSLARCSASPLLWVKMTSTSYPFDCR